MALGAQPGDVTRLVLGQATRLAGWGVAIGLVAAIPLATLASRFLYAISPIDPVTYSSVGAGLVAVAAAASLPPARRALRIDPAIALRHD